MVSPGEASRSSSLSSYLHCVQWPSLFLGIVGSGNALHAASLGPLAYHKVLISTRWRRAQATFIRHPPMNRLGRPSNHRRAKEAHGGMPKHPFETSRANHLFPIVRCLSHRLSSHTIIPPMSLYRMCLQQPHLHEAPPRCRTCRCSFG